jgi:hypothetical protein
MYEDHHYERTLRKFLKENTGKNERDFINQKLEALNQDLKTKESEFPNIDEKQLRKLVMEKFGFGYDFEIYPKKGYPEDWMILEVEKEEKNLKSAISGCKQYIFEYELKLKVLF